MSAQRLPVGWPNAQHSRWVKSGPHNWHIQEHGQGPKVLLLHGAGGSCHSWAGLFAPLAQDHHVLALDLPGQGFSQLGNRARCGLEPMSADIADLLEALTFQPDHIIAHSAGAAIALNMSLSKQSPPKITTLNGAFLGFSGLAGLLFPALAKMLSLNPLTALAVSRLSNRSGMTRNILASTGSTLSPQQQDWYQTLVGTRSHVDATLAMMAQWKLDPLMERLPEVTADVHLIVGSNDSTVPPTSSRNAAARIPGAKLSELPGLGHLMHEDAPEQVLQHILDPSNF